MARTKKVVITAFGDESKLAIVDSDLSDPAAGEVQLSVKYSIVSGSDVNMRRGTYPLQKKPPLTPGYSVIGVVRLNGQDCSKFKISDRVACLSKYEGQAELINLPEKYLVRVPEGVDGKAAVALILDWVTAYQMLHRATHVTAGQKIFVHALSGAVGGGRFSGSDSSRELKSSAQLHRPNTTNCVNLELFRSIIRIRTGSLPRRNPVSTQSSIHLDSRASTSLTRS